MKPLESSARGISMETQSSQSNSLLNGLIPVQRSSETLSHVSVNPIRLKKSSRTLKLVLGIGCLTIVLAFLFLITIEFSTKLLGKEEELNSTKMTNQPKSFFACVWFYHLFFLIFCLLIHILIYRRDCSHGNVSLSVFVRDFGRIFVDEKSSSMNSLIDYLVKTCLLCVLWYFSSYLIFRSMSILHPSEVIILYSITITLRQVLGWIFLHEQFIGNKIIAHILSLSALLFLAHNDGFRFNRYFFGLSMVTCSVTMKTIFDILIDGFIKELNSFKLRIVMINVCLCGTSLLWPFVLLFHLTRFEPIEINHFHPILFLITLISALVFNILTISMPRKYTSIANVAALLLVIPSISLIDRYYFNVKYSPLVISAILCSFSAVLLSIIPKQCFQPGEAMKIKQVLALFNRDSNVITNLGTTGIGNPTSSAFEEIRAQRRIRNAFLYNEIKT